jgi:hypothetical protein
VITTFPETKAIARSAGFLLSISEENGHFMGRLNLTFFFESRLMIAIFVNRQCVQQGK